MPDPKQWYEKPHANEIIAPLLDNSKFEERIRIRFLTKKIGKSKKRDIEIFSVGFEIKTDERWKVVVRHCNYHTESVKEFHTHNEYKLPCLGDEEKIIRKLKYKKSPASQYRWAVKNIRHLAGLYRKEFLKI